jgi:hypothetical protein
MATKSKTITKMTQRDVKKELAKARKDRDDAVECSVDLAERLLAVSRESSGLLHHVNALTNANEAQERQINQLQSSLGAFRDRFKARVSEMNMEARFWGISISELLKA